MTAKAWWGLLEFERRVWQSLSANVECVVLYVCGWGCLVERGYSTKQTFTLGISPSSTRPPCQKKAQTPNPTGFTDTCFHWVRRQLLVCILNGSGLLIIKKKNNIYTGMRDARHNVSLLFCSPRFTIQQTSLTKQIKQTNQALRASAYFNKWKTECPLVTVIRAALSIRRGYGNAQSHQNTGLQCAFVDSE